MVPGSRMARPVYEFPSIANITIISNHQESPGIRNTWWVKTVFQKIIKAYGQDKLVA